MPPNEDGVNVEAEEEAIPESPTEKITPSEEVAPAAEVTGEEQPQEPGEVETPGPVPYERFKEVNERAKLARTYEERLEAYEQLLSDPVVRQAAEGAYQRRMTGVSPGAPAQESKEEVLAREVERRFGADWTPDMLSDETRVLLEGQIAIEQRLEAAQMSSARETANQQLKVYNAKVDELAKATGLTLTEDQRREVDVIATDMHRGSVERGTPRSPEEVAAFAFRAALGDTLTERQTATARAAEVDAEKRRLAASRTGGRSPSGEPNQVFETPEEAAEAAWDKTKHLFQAEGLV